MPLPRSTEPPYDVTQCPELPPDHELYRQPITIICNPRSARAIVRERARKRGVLMPTSSEPAAAGTDAPSPSPRPETSSEAGADPSSPSS